MEERVVHAVEGHAFGDGAHCEGGDVVAPAVLSGHPVEVERAIVLFEDLDACGVGVAILGWLLAF